MGYDNGRSSIENILAITLCFFLIGFITSLCIGNFMRAKRAQARQTARRLARRDLEAQNARLKEKKKTFSLRTTNNNASNNNKGSTRSASVLPKMSPYHDNPYSDKKTSLLVIDEIDMVADFDFDKQSMMSA